MCILQYMCIYLSYVHITWSSAFIWILGGCCRFFLHQRIEKILPVERGSRAPSQGLANPSPLQPGVIHR